MKVDPKVNGYGDSEKPCGTDEREVVEAAMNNGIGCFGDGLCSKVLEEEIHGCCLAEVDIGVSNLWVGWK